MSSSLRPRLKFTVVALLLLTLALGLSPLLAQETREDQKAKEEKEKQAKITEEILVVGKSPKDVPLATVTSVTSTDIDKLKPRDLADVLKFVPAAYVTFGDKDTYTLKLRGVGVQPHRPLRRRRPRL